MISFSRCLTFRIYLLSLLFLTSSMCFAQKKEDTLNVSLINTLIDFRPFINYNVEKAAIAYALHDGLFVGNQEGEVIQSLASALEVFEEDNLHRYDVTLREDAKWSDGSRLVAGDFARGLRVLLHPDIKNYLQKDWSEMIGFDAYRETPENPTLLGVQVVNDTKLSLTFNRPVPFIKYMLSSPNLIPFPPAAENPEYWKKPADQLFSGRYTLNQPLDQFPLILKRNSHYTGVQPLIYETINLYRHEKKQSYSQLAGKIIEGKLDVVFKLPAQLTILKEVHQDIIVEQHRTLSTYALFNTQRKPFDQTEIRQLFKKVINLTSAQDRLFRASEKKRNKNAFFVPEKFGGLPQKPYSRDVVQKNRQLLAEKLAALGYSKDNRLTLKIPTGPAGMSEKVGRYICDQIHDEAGVIDCHVVVRESITDYYKENIKTRDYDLIYIGWNLDTPYAIDLLNVFTTDHSSNHALWSDKKYDAMIREIKYEPDLEKMRTLSPAAEAYFLDKAVVMPLQASRPTLHGLALGLERQLPIAGGDVIDFVAIKRIAQ